MREVKFRVWHDDSYVDIYDWAGVEWFDPVFGDWEQFTGLHDKHGKEIYEGDIVAVGVYGSGNIHNTQVVFRNSGFRLEKGHGALLFPSCEAGNVEVIGNIHENPELLK